MKVKGSPRKPGKRGRTRSKLRKRTPKVSVNDIMTEFSVGDKVGVIIDSSYHSGLPDKNFHGLTGVVLKKRGEAYEVNLLKGKKNFLLVTTSVHLKKLV